jgi:hypothetical protein
MRSRRANAALAAERSGAGPAAGAEVRGAARECTHGAARAVERAGAGLARGHARRAVGTLDLARAARAPELADGLRARACAATLARREACVARLEGRVGGRVGGGCVGLVADATAGGEERDQRQPVHARRSAIGVPRARAPRFAERRSESSTVGSDREQTSEPRSRGPGSGIERAAGELRCAEEARRDERVAPLRRNRVRAPRATEARRGTRRLARPSVDA